MRTESDAIRSLQRLFAGLLPEPWEVRLTLEAGVEPRRPYALVEQNGPAATTGAPVTQDVTLAYTVNLYLAEPSDGRRGTADDAAMALREQVWQAIKWGPDPRRATTDRIPLFAFMPRLEVQRVRVAGATSGAWALNDGLDQTAPLAFDATAEAVQAALDAARPDAYLVEPRGAGLFDIHFLEAAGVEADLLTIDASDLVRPTAPTVVRVLAGAVAPWRSPSDFMRVLSFGQTTIRDPDNPALVQVAVDLRCTFARGLRLPFGQMILQRISATSGSGG